MNSTNISNKLNLFNTLFKLIFVAFWIIFWFIGVILTDNKFNQLSTTLFISYSSICIIYIIAYLVYMKVTKVYENKIEIYYKLVTILSFVFSSYSYYILPLSMFWFLVKLSVLFFYMYISILKVYKYKMEEGVVGIIGAALMIFMFVRY
ncbi:hypothetical protein QJR30_13055 [Paraclostridium sordellii]|uniref:hypothetical protein n=1 Tax=Paraclostridium sordellii TaxID=1505 RepID=UPI0005EA11D5|nr:hypothetical protein [Paeniclostridium sordellii]CEP81428.1 membrane protein [[Clostridium] sordellii] [Paeniclostridium sordellii]